jgi:hypothetical protein
MADTRKPSGQPNETTTESPDAKAAASEPTLATKAGRISFTIDAESGRMVTVESVDDAGVRRELTSEEKVDLAKATSKETLEDILETTFEAGITAVLGDDGEEDEAESEESTKLRHLILAPMIAKSAARRFMKREVLRGAILGALIQDNVTFGGSDTETVGAPERRGGPSGRSRRAPRPGGAPQ